MSEIQYFFSHLSPWTYMGHQRFIEMAGKAGRSIRFIPVESGKVFSTSGGLPLNKRPEQRRTYRLIELERWRDTLGVPLNLQPKFHPAPDAPSASLALAAERAGQDISALSFALMQGCWVDDQDLSDAVTLIKIADGAGFDGKALFEASQDDEIAAKLQANTDEAIASKVFGYPWYIVDGTPFWGQDRLDFVERALNPT